MKKNRTLKLAISSMLIAVSVLGSMFSFPIFGARCAPVQHMVNIICAVFLGPGYGVGVAFCASLLRNLMGLGSLLAFPGSMIGALCCGIVFYKTQNLFLTLLSEAIGTGIVGGLCAYPIAIVLMGQSAAGLAFYAFVFPFFISTVCGSVAAGVLISCLKKSGGLQVMKHIADRP